MKRAYRDNLSALYFTSNAARQISNYFEEDLGRLSKSFSYSLKY